MFASPIAQLSADMKALTSLPESISSKLRYFSRKPILDRSRRVFAQEFLFCSERRGHFLERVQEQVDDATFQMAENSILYDFECLAGGRKAFLNCTREFLLGNRTALPHPSTVLQLPPSSEANDEIVEACRALRVRGYQLALSGFVPRPGVERLLPLADYIKIDLSRTDAWGRRGVLRYLRQRQSAASVIAVNVDTEEDFESVMEEGFQLFQGNCFSDPQTQARHGVPTNTLNHLGLLAEMENPSCDWPAIERLVRNDPRLLCRVLEEANATEYRRRAGITSVQMALTTIGEAKFRRVALTAVSGALARDKPSELLLLALQRANFCELASFALNQDPEEQYLFGLVSLLPAMLGTSAAQVTGLLPLSAPVKAALLGESNGIATALHVLHQYQVCDNGYGRRFGLRDEDVDRWHLESLLRAEQAAHLHLGSGCERISV